MNKEEIKRLPFVVKAYSMIYPTESQCGICGLPWSAGGIKSVNIGQDWGVFYVCPYCWENRSKEEILRASVLGYMSQYESVARNESDRENFLKNHQLDEILFKIEQEYDKTHKIK